MPIASAEVVVVDWDGAAAGAEVDIAAQLSRLLAAGVDVVLVPSPTCTAAARVLDTRPERAGRLVLLDPDQADDPVEWARERIAGRGAPAAAVAVARDAAALDELLETASGFPVPVADAAWRLDVAGVDPARERETESWLTVGNGRTGTRGSLEEGTPYSLPALYVAGVFGHDPAEQAGPELVRGPEWTHLGTGTGAGATDATHRVLDLRQGMLLRDTGDLRSARFASLAERRLLVLEAEGDGWHAEPVPPPEVMGALGKVECHVDGDTTRMHLQGRGNGGASFMIATTHDPCRVVRLVTVDRDVDTRAEPRVEPRVEPDEQTVDAADLARLRGGHRRAWRDRWFDADVVVRGDDDAQHALRFAAYHLISAGDPDSDVASIGARAMTGPGYRGHVFWDTEIFVLPFFVWTHPQTARALLAYRHRTLPAARAKAARLGYEGALYAWESADTGDETTPEHVVLPDGHRLTILTGLQEHHIAADVAWAVMQYCLVTGDDGFLEEMGAEIVLETARFWASRVTEDQDGRFHICKVIGPDEYHEGVDDNAYTNVLARWNLRTADALCDRLPGVTAKLGIDDAARRRWREVADRLVDGFDAARLLYEQFDGFFDLEPVRAVDLAPRPFTGEMVVGVERLRRTQIVKQADVIMLGVLLPDVVGREVQAANYHHYEPLTSHGSSLSPAMHALAAARVGDLADAVDYFELAAGVDLENRMGNAAEGVHIATMGGLWQAAVFGFGGVQAEVAANAVRIDPHVPESWDELAFALRWRGGRICVEVRGDALSVELEHEADVALGSGPPEKITAGRHMGRCTGDGWSWVRPA